jgi:hypothetical protein
VSQSGLIAWYVQQKIRSVTYPAKGCTRDVQAARKLSAEAPNLSKGEICSNYSLSICVYVSIIIDHPAQGAGSAGTVCPQT